MKVLLIQSWLGREQHPVLPLGLAGIAAGLEGHTVRIVDPNISTDPMSFIRGTAREFRPDVVGISLRNCDTTSYTDIYSYMPAFSEQTDLIRKELPDVFLIAGGAGFSIFPGEVMESCPQVDCGVTGHGEEITRGLIENRAKGVHPGHAGVFVKPRLDLLDLGPYRGFQKNLSAGVEVNRGCGNRCSYCSYGAVSGRSTLERDTPSIIHDVEFYIEKGFSHIFLVAPLLNTSRRRGLEVADALSSTDCSITWEAYHTARDFDESYALAIADSGCTAVSFSPDGGTDLQMKLMGKNYSGRELEKAIHAAASAGLSVSLNVFPWNGETGFHGMLQAFINGTRWGRIAGNRLRRLRFGLVRRMPGTPFAPASLKPGLDEFAAPPGGGMAAYLILKRLLERNSTG